jgi:hypothetical protein
MISMTGSDSLGDQGLYSFPGERTWGIAKEGFGVFVDRYDESL